jgi:hypothetical protein
MYTRILYLILLGAISTTNAQMINEQGLKDLSVMFNTSYVKNNKIKEIVGHTAYKKELKPIVDKHVFNRYEFDSKGQLIQLTEIFKKSPTSIDSLITQFVYQGGKIEEKHVLDAHGQHAYSFVFNDKQDVLKMQYHRIDERDNSSILVLEETYEYEYPNDTTTIKWYLNQYGKKYQKEIHTYNNYKYLLSVEKRMVFGGGVNLQTFKYDEKGRLVELVEERNGSSLKTIYVYDKFNNIIEKDSFKNNVQTYHDEYLYDSSTSLLKAHLSKDLNTNTIYITKFEVIFW